MKKEGEERVKKTRRGERGRETKAELERRKRKRGEGGGGRGGGVGFGHTASPEEIFMGAHLRAASTRGRERVEFLDPFRLTRKTALRN